MFSFLLPRALIKLKNKFSAVGYILLIKSVFESLKNKIQQPKGQT